MGDSGVHRPSPSLTARSLPKPLQGEMWPKVVTRLKFAPQEARVVELVVRGQGDKQIAQSLKIKVPTVRTYLGRAFERADVEDRVGLVVRVMEMAHELSVSDPRRSS